MTEASWRELIATDPGRRGGLPCLRGTRIAVVDVLDWLASGMSAAEIVDDFPEVTRQHILACLAYAADRERDVAAAAE